MLCGVLGLTLMRSAAQTRPLWRSQAAAKPSRPEPQQAHALAQSLEIHHTPKHGSWLNIAEIELSALTRQCLDRRIGDLEVLNSELAAWQNEVNTDQRQVRWQFTTGDARIKLRHLYPSKARISSDNLLAAVAGQESVPAKPETPL